MAVVAAQPTLVGIPCELRLPIYEQIFENAYLRVCPGDYQVWPMDVQAFNSWRAITQVNQQLRLEATPLFERTLFLTVPSKKDLLLASKACPGLKEIHIGDEPYDVSVYRAYFPNIERVIIECYTLDEYLKRTLVCRSWTDLFLTLCGKRDEAVMQKLKVLADSARKVGAARYVPDDMSTGPDEPPCTVICKLQYMQIGWQENMGLFRLSDELKFYYRLDIDVTNWRIAYRGMLFRPPGQYSKEKEWIPSEEIMILTDGLRWPALYHPRTDKLRVMWRGKEDEVERNNEQQERIALEEWNLLGFGPPSEFWADRYRNKNILDKALKHQCFCVPEDAHSRACAALRLLGDKDETANQAVDN